MLYDVSMRIFLRLYFGAICLITEICNMNKQQMQ